MPGKPYQSKLLPFEEEVFALRRKGTSYRKIAKWLREQHGLNVTHNAVFSFVKCRHPHGGTRGLFYHGLDQDLRDQLLKRIVAEWTHDSTAIEGNTLTLGETTKILALGLTIEGKPLREHLEVYGHARAIELVYGMIESPALSEEDLYVLHRAVMPQSPVDVLSPIGAWKRDYNGTTGVADGKTVYLEYARPDDVPILMQRWLDDFNGMHVARAHPRSALKAYVRAHMVFVRVHPFFDGNGRVARLIANLPVIRSGFPPVVVPAERRADYIDLLWQYQSTVGTIKRGSRLLPPHPAIRQFEELLRQGWQTTVAMVEEARQRQAQRDEA